MRGRTEICLGSRSSEESTPPRASVPFAVIAVEASGGNAVSAVSQIVRKTAKASPCVLAALATMWDSMSIA